MARTLPRGGSGADNNGNISRQEIFIPGSNYYQQNYSYDQLNRLTSVVEKLNGGSDSFNQTFDYDRYGNRTINAAATFNAPEPQFDPSQMYSQNRLYSPGENISSPCDAPLTTSRLMCYDAAGNMIRDKHVTNAAWMTYDGDGKMFSHNVNNVQDDTITYLYDADGKRKWAFSGTKTTKYVHGLGGELLADVGNTKAKIEFGYRNGQLLLSAKSAQSDIRWMVTDHLGTPRIVADKTGSLAAIKRHDYLPFGEEIGPTVGGRDTSQGYGNPQSDGVRQQFTGYERDQESGLDYAQARYFGSSLGRFTAVDPITMKEERLLDPQRINLYAYARNQPLLYVDATGEDIHIAIGGKSVGKRTIRIINAGEGQPQTMVVDVYRMNVYDDVTEQTSSYFVTRDAPVMKSQNDPSYVGSLLGYESTFTVVNSAFEPEGAPGKMTEFRGVPLKYPPGTDLEAIALRTTSGSGDLPAERNENADRANPKMATGIMIHVGGLYQGKDGSTRRAASLGCFGVCDADNKVGNQNQKNFISDVTKRQEINKKMGQGTAIRIYVTKRSNVKKSWELDKNGVEQ